MIRSDYETACGDAQAMRESVYGLSCKDCMRDMVSDVPVSVKAMSIFEACRQAAGQLCSLVTEDAIRIEQTANAFLKADQTY